jgi:glutaredoxin-like protein NrdH
MAQKEVTVYSKPACVQCTATKRWLESKGIDYVEDDAIANLDHIQALLQFKQAPVIRVVDSSGTATFWYGHNPDELAKNLIAA